MAKKFLNMCYFKEKENIIMRIMLINNAMIDAEVLHEKK